MLDLDRVIFGKNNIQFLSIIFKPTNKESQLPMLKRRLNVQHICFTLQLLVNGVIQYDFPTISSAMATINHFIFKISPEVFSFCFGLEPAQP